MVCGGRGSVGGGTARPVSAHRHPASACACLPRRGAAPPGSRGARGRWGGPGAGRWLRAAGRGRPIAPPGLGGGGGVGGLPRSSRAAGRRHRAGTAATTTTTTAPPKKERRKLRFTASPLLLPSGGLPVPGAGRERCKRLRVCVVALRLGVMISGVPGNDYLCLCVRECCPPPSRIGVRLFSCFTRCFYCGSSDAAGEAESPFESRRLPAQPGDFPGV